MFLGLESGVTYNIQIRACDVYENRSAWSTVEDKVTATDSGTPTKIAGETATAILAGIKIEWTESPEDNISYYFIERQESPDNVDWSGAWTERVRIEADMWLDLLLTYSKYYRYRITAYTVAGVAGVVAPPPCIADSSTPQFLAITTAASHVAAWNVWNSFRDPSGNLIVYVAIYIHPSQSFLKSLMGESGLEGLPRLRYFSLEFRMFDWGNLGISLAVTLNP